MAQHGYPRHNLRLPPELKARLAHARIDAGRSMNAEILARLEHSFDPDPAAQLVAALRPVATLSEEDRKKVGAMLAEIGNVFARSKQK